MCVRIRLGVLDGIKPSPVSRPRSENESQKTGENVHHLQFATMRDRRCNLLRCGLDNHGRDSRRSHTYLRQCFEPPIQRATRQHTVGVRVRERIAKKLTNSLRRAKQTLGKIVQSEATDRRGFRRETKRLGLLCSLTPSEGF